MSERLLSPVAFITVDVILVCLTVLTVGLSFVPGSGTTHIIFGLTIGLAKASLVVLFFMHALRSTAQTRAVIAVTIFWLLIVFIVLTFSDYITRGLIPTMYGH